MISVLLRTTGDEILDPMPFDEISEVIADPTSLLWVDVVDPTREELALLREEFGFHPLALEDVAKEGQRPKLEYYGETAFVVFYRLSRDAEGEVHADQIGLFVGRNYLVTVHREVSPPLGQVRERWAHNVHHIGADRLGLLLYSVLDQIVDDYLPILDAVSEEIDAIEGRIFVDFDARVQQQVFGLKKNLLAMRRVVSPERDVVNELMRLDDGSLGPTTSRYLGDIHDHLLRVLDTTDLHRELLASALDSYLSMSSNRLNLVMRRLTASSIILMGMTLVASVYGMNFVHMPELHWRLGYPMALALMVTIGVSLAVAMRRNDWL